MRILGIVAVGSLALVASAFADNMAVTGLATASANAWLTGFEPSNALNYTGSTANIPEWVAPGGTVNPYLLITLTTPSIVDMVTVNGVGNTGLFSAFEIFIGSAAVNISNAVAGLSSLSQSSAISQLTTAGMVSIGTQTDQVDGSYWSDIYNFSPTSVKYVMYLGISGSGTGCSTNPCEPGSASFSGGLPVSGQDDAFTTGIVVASPEPATFGLFGAAALLLGAVRRFRK